MNNKEEVWLPVKGYEGLYEVSNLGIVKSLKFGKQKKLKGGLGSSGYISVNLCKLGVQETNRIHKLVAIAFFNHNPNGYRLVINHINFNKLDNRAVNLEVVTNRKNTNKKHINSSSKYTGVYWNKASKKWKCSICINGKRKYLGLFDTEILASKAYEKELE